MSTDRRLEHELLHNSQVEEEFLRDLETEFHAQRDLFQMQQSQIAIRMHQSKMDLSPLYLERDRTFFNTVHLLQQMSSQIRLVTDFQQAAPIPKIQHSDRRIASVIEKYDSDKSEYLADFENFLRDKQRHDRELERLNLWMIDLQDQITHLVIPYILYFLLEWLPPIITIYRYFNPINSLDTAIILGQKLERDLNETEQDILAEHARFYKTWGERYTEYHALSMNEKQYQQMRVDDALYQHAQNCNQHLQYFMQRCKHEPTLKAYAQFTQHPNYINLFHLNACLNEQKFNHPHQAKEIDKCLQDLQDLYPEIEHELKQYSQRVTLHFKESGGFYLLEDKYHRLIENSKSMLEKAKAAKVKMEAVILQSNSLNPIRDAMTLYQNRTEIEKLSNFIEGVKEKLAKRRKLIEVFKQFLQRRTGENLLKLHQYISDPNHEEAVEFADLLTKLYPHTLRTLSEERRSNISIPTREVSALSLNHLQNLIAIERSTEKGIQIESFKQVAKAFKPFLQTADWTWEHIYNLEITIRNHPNYVQNPILAAIMNDITRIISQSRQFQIKVERRASSTVPQPSPELVINSSTQLPTFFQPPSRVSNVANELIREILGTINAYKIRTLDGDLSSPKKQETIVQIGIDMQRYIDILSGEEGHQTISPEHLTLLKNMAQFIQKLVEEQSITEMDIEHTQNLLGQLDPVHPVRKGMEFLIAIIQSKVEYMAISTSPAQAQLAKEIAREIVELEKKRESNRARREKYRHTSSMSVETRNNLDQWEAAFSMLTIIKTYRKNLEQYASAQSATEKQAVQTLVELGEQIYDGLRYEKYKRGQPLPLQQLVDHCDKLRPHPIIGAGEAFFEALQSTKEYSDLLSFEPDLKLKMKN